MRKFSVAAVTLLLSACAVGPDYQAPPTPEPEAFHAAELTAVSRQPVSYTHLTLPTKA